ncbi:hypothetical protein [Parvicella tangerina]|uniref:Lipoprotein n=1 Tax=Parvicella tangerina TaxID=2829795 RepID=A0A916JKN0_9FLAO|nr:hypothetical protein [Parvicella tangerina]CAG5076258.1 hypothetical protein CRYO30217_00012 [Parvicella tangerina]
MRNSIISLLTLASIFGVLTSCNNTTSQKEEKEPSKSEQEHEEILTYDDCLGDYVELQKDINQLFIGPLKQEEILLGKTTKEEMKELTGHADKLTKDYNGIELTAFYTYEDDVLKSIAIDCFYQCEEALELLPVDQAAITNALNKAIGEKGATDNDSDAKSVSWNFNGMTIRKTNFEDGYGIYIDANL